jgi:mannosyltransferase
MNSKGDGAPLDELEVIIPNLKKRYSGGTAVNRTIAPLIAERCRTAWLGPDRPQGVAGLGVVDLVRLRFRQPKRSPARIWHARRNSEMLLGLVLKRLGWKLKLIFNSAGQRTKTRYTAFLVARMDAVIATSETSASFVERSATIIHHGIDVESYRPPADRLAAFAATGLPGKYGIGTFGRVRRQKGVDLFVEAACRLLPKYPDFTAVVIGFVSVDNRLFVDGLKQRIAAAGLSDRIRFLGELPIKEVPIWYQRISIYVFASRVEGFGLTMLEAMAAGDAVVATRAGSAETVIADGETGMLAPVDDIDGLVEALEPLMRNPERMADMGARARARVVKDFSRDREVDEIVSVYRRLWQGEKAPKRRPG